MKKYILYIAIFAMLLNLLGCSKKDDGGVQDTAAANKEEDSREQIPVIPEIPAISGEDSPSPENPQKTEGADSDAEDEHITGLVKSGDQYLSYADDGTLVPHPNKEKVPAEGTLVFIFGKYFLWQDGKWIMFEENPVKVEPNVEETPETADSTGEEGGSDVEVTQPASD